MLIPFFPKVMELVEAFLMHYQGQVTEDGDGDEAQADPAQAGDMLSPCFHLRVC